MKVVIDTHLSESKITGIGRYINELVIELLKHAPTIQLSLITNSKNTQMHPLEKLSPGTEKVPINLKGPSIRQHTVIPKILKKISPDIYHHPHFDLPFFQRVPSVITIHDLKYMRHPDFFADLGLAKSIYMKLMMADSIRRARKIIAVSKSTKKDLISMFNVDENKIKVIYHGKFHFSGKPVHDFNINQLGITRPYILFVGERRPHKNLPNLIQAFYRLIRKFKDQYQLVIVGKAYADYQEPEKMIKSYRLNNDVILTGYLSDEQLDFLYKNAYIFILPSYYEGFGFPLLEAMASGIPVLGSDRTSVPEIIGEAGLLFNPDNVEEIADRMLQMVSNADLRNRLKESGYHRAKQFSWEKTAKETVDVYLEVYEGLKKSYQ